MQGRGESRAGVGDEGIEGGIADRRERRIELAGGSRLGRRGRRRRCRIRLRALEARRERAQARLDADAGGADRRFISLAARTAARPLPASAPNSTAEMALPVLVGERGHVEGDETFRGRPGGLIRPCWNR